jgi:hypothetical protein
LVSEQSCRIGVNSRFCSSLSASILFRVLLMCVAELCWHLGQLGPFFMLCLAT